MKLYKLNKKVYSVSNGAEKFLQGLTSNDLDKPYNAFCNLHGKIIATFEQIKVGEDEYWIIVSSHASEELLGHLDKYIKLSKVKFEELPNHLVYFDCSGGVPGHRAGDIVVSEKELQPIMNEDEFTNYRLENDIPLHGVDYFSDFLLNVSDEKYVSYTKGCFLGQEPISKVHNRSKPSWQLTVKMEKDCSEEEKAKMTSKSVDPSNGEVKGFVFVRNEKE